VLVVAELVEKTFVGVVGSGNDGALAGMVEDDDFGVGSVVLDVTG